MVSLMVQAARPLVLTLLVMFRLTPGCGFGIGGWLSNDGTASKSIVVDSSGTTPSGSPLLERQKGYMAVDGNMTSQWNAMIDPHDQSCWLVLDFGAEVTVHGFAVVQRGDITHDVKDHELQTSTTKDGPWQSVGIFVGQQCKPPAFRARQCREKNQAGAAAFRQTFDLPSASTSRYFRWVAKTRFSEYQLYLYEIQFRGSAWGAMLLILSGLCTCFYVFGGIAMGARTDGKPWRMSSHPHMPLWVELHALVLDGISYSRAVARGRLMTGERYTAARRSVVRDGRSQQDDYGAISDRKSDEKEQRSGSNHKKVTKERKRSRGNKPTKPTAQPGHDQTQAKGDGESHSGGTATARPNSPGGDVNSRRPGRWIHVP